MRADWMMADWPPRNHWALGPQTGGNDPAMQMPGPMTGGPLPPQQFQPQPGGQLPPQAFNPQTGGNLPPQGYDSSGINPGGMYTRTDFPPQGQSAYGNNWNPYQPMVNSWGGWRG